MADTSSSKCCCCQCSKGCQNIGSLIPDCTACGEMPEYFGVGGFCGGVGAGAYWPCCTALEQGMLLLPPASGCVYSSLPFTVVCNNGGPAQGVTFHWQLDPGSSCNDPVLKLVGDDGTVMVWKLPPSLRGAWRPLCSTILYRYGSLDVAGTKFGDPTYCYAPPRLCLGALGPCCPQRTSPLPRTLHGTWTQNAPGAPCPCADGATITLNWNNVTKRWYGSAEFGSCGGIVEIEIWCLRQIPQTATIWMGRYRMTATTNNQCSTEAGPPGNRQPVWQDFSANTVGWAIAECDPIHLRTTFSFDGCCLRNPSQIQFDVTE